MLATVAERKLFHNYETLKKKSNIEVNLNVIWDILQHPNPNKIGQILY